MIKREYSLEEKLNILADAAKYDVACTSSGSTRRGKKGYTGNTCPTGICHSFSADGRCVSLLKILYSNDCIYDCLYCLNRCSNNLPRATFEPDEICRLVMEFYKRNYIEGLFLSSAVYGTPEKTMERILYTVWLLRTKYRFNGYIHVKAIPHAPAELIERTGWLADRMSINLELPASDSLRRLAPSKTHSAILTPMRQIQYGISDDRLSRGLPARMPRSKSSRILGNTVFHDTVSSFLMNEKKEHIPVIPDRYSLIRHSERTFVPAGQSTQIIIGATDETDYEILSVSQTLYRQFDLKRVFYSAYIPLNDEPDLPALDTAPPLLREHRLYQADWLLRFYGFRAEELLDQEHPDFNPDMDPKCDWAVRHLELFPLEVETADYASLLRVPGIGIRSAGRIIRARRTGHLDFESLKHMGVVLKRAAYFITCNGHMYCPIRLEQKFLTRQLTGFQSRETWQISHPESFRQLSLFDDMGLPR